VDIKPIVKVRDSMHTPVVTVNEDETIDKVAKLIAKHGIGCVIVVDSKKNPLGIITERDVVTRVVVKNLLPSKIKASKVMSTPIETISPDASIEEAAKRMSKSDIRRLAVLEKGKMIGIISSRDIVSVTPALIEVITEKARAGAIVTKERPPLAGYCDNCGQWSELLKEVDGKFLCDDCITDLGEKQET
jgi:CBS domain-containing protein